MSQFLEQPALFDQIMRLGEEDRQRPFLVIERFFADYHLHECRDYLWAMVEACLTTDNVVFGEPEERADLLLHYADLEKLLEACSLLLLHRDGPELSTGIPGAT
jgi:hypothetical protein